MTECVFHKKQFANMCQYLADDKLTMCPLVDDRDAECRYAKTKVQLEASLEKAEQNYEQTHGNRKGYSRSGHGYVHQGLSIEQIRRRFGL